MSVLIFVESNKGKIKKNSLEAVYYGSQVAQQLGVAAIAMADEQIESTELSRLGNYGAQKVLTIQHQNLTHLESKAYSYLVTEVAKQINAQVIIFSHNLTGKAIGSIVSAKLKAGFVAGAVSLPNFSNGCTIKSGAYSGKAFAYYNINTAIKVIAVTPNAIKPVVTDATCEIAAISIAIPADQFTTVVKETITASDKIVLTEADLVVSGGRGLKGPENWGMVEEMANILGAATACSRAVADVHWRPHHEHVGQTGYTVRPNLYVAIGISGAIQHLAGVNQSKTIVVINTDKEAPFFKAADYGIIGDAFDVVPKLNEALKKFKATQ
jgi:electron transfer flavoprotein alpha subunit